MQASSLPEELLNEPYTYRDSGLRPEYKIQRPFFLFSAFEGGGASCIVGSSRISVSEGQSYSLAIPLEKCVSRFSVVSVYDTYGLRITYEFLKHLYFQKRYRSSWLVTYLRGSLAILDLGTLDSTHENADVMHWCSLLLSRLSELDSKQPRPIEQVTSSSVLPIEMLALITNSVRLSKNVAREVISQRC